MYSTLSLSLSVFSRSLCHCCKNTHSHAHVRTQQDIAEKVVKTIGQAFEVAYHKVMKARNSKQPGKKTSPTETVIAKTATVAASATCSSAS